MHSDYGADYLRSARIHHSIHSTAERRERSTTHVRGKPRVIVQHDKRLLYRLDDLAHALSVTGICSSCVAIGQVTSPR